MHSYKDKPFIVHPLLFAIYPVVALLAINIEEIKTFVALRAIVVSVVICTIMYFILKSLFKDRLKAAVATSAILILFFSYGHLYNYLESATIFGLTLGRHRVLLPVYTAVALLCLVWLFRKNQDLRLINNVLNWMAVVALVLPIIQIGTFEFRTTESRVSFNDESSMISDLRMPEDQKAPDIYYIIVDAYARDDTLLEDNHLDISPFLNELESMGFYIARCSQSNYSQTQLSLSSSLNMNYLQDLGEQLKAGNTSRAIVQELIHQSLVRQALEHLGYTIIAFETGFKGTQWEDADIYLSPSNTALEKMQVVGGLSDFEVMLLRTSAGLLVSDAGKILPAFIQANLDNPRLIHRQRILFTLDQLHKIPSLPGPKFVFAHMVIPHPPYVFGPNGEFTDYDLDAKTGYHDQIIYLNKQLIPLIKDLITKSEIPPVIIIQADHGAIHSPPAKRLNILNAYFLPNHEDSLYKSISPVNSFRVVFDDYFGGKLKLLNDVSYFSIYQTPYEYTVIPNTRPGCESAQPGG